MTVAWAFVATGAVFLLAGRITGIISEDMYRDETKRRTVLTATGLAITGGLCLIIAAWTAALTS